MKFAIEVTQESTAHKKSSHTSRAKKSVELRKTPLRFVGVDGEGFTDAYGVHRYAMFGIGQDQIINNDGLGYDEIFTFLYDNFETGGVAYVGFFLGYDFTQWLKTLPEERVWKLITEEGKKARAYKNSNRAIPRPVEVGHKWEIDLLGTKRFKLRPVGIDPTTNKPYRFMYICDAGPFFQKSFLKVIDPSAWSVPITTDEEYRTILEGKARRGGDRLTDDDARYNRLENEILARVMSELDKGIRELDIHLKPDQWFGPGQAASAWLKGRAPYRTELDGDKDKGIRALVPSWWMAAARNTYYGGWFEIMCHGIIPGTTHEYDINSAYPWAISQLPCLLHGKYRRGEGKPPKLASNIYRITYARVTSCNDYIGPMPHRNEDGSILRPKTTAGWHWQDEIEAGVEAGIINPKTIQWGEYYTYEACNCPPPLREVADIYALRKRVGKKTPLGIACKLVPNSLYGKFAQSIGNPIFGNPIYASLITSRCRIKILEAIGTHPDGAKGVLMVATDGIYFRSPHPTLRITGELGDWDHEEKENICLFKPGVYWDDKARAAIAAGSAPVFKARGVNARDFATELANVDEMFRTNVPGETVKWPTVTFPIAFSMQTALQALRRGKWELAGSVSGDVTNTQSSNPMEKRCDWYWDQGIIRSKTHKQGDTVETVAYRKEFGLENLSNPLAQITRELFGYTPDGLVADVWKEVLFDG